MEFEILETPRLILRKLTPKVYEYIYNHFTDKECIEHLGLTTQEELEREKEKFRKGLSAYDRTFIVFQLIEKSTNKVIGMCGYVRYYPDHFRAELGYSLNFDSAKRKGYMSEAAPIIVDYGFHELKLIRMEAMVGPTNIPSLKIVTQLGFEQEGLMRQHFHRNGVMEDSAIFSLLKS